MSQRYYQPSVAISIAVCGELEALGIRVTPSSLAAILQWDWDMASKLLIRYNRHITSLIFGASALTGDLVIVVDNEGFVMDGLQIR